jgi:1,2-diacylglycerol 3-beta-glucosyltransferase
MVGCPVGCILVGLLLAARTLKGEPEASRPRVDPLPRLAVFVPAHDEESVIGATVSALLNADYPPERRQIIVIADNCHDATASVARLEGAEVWERDEPDRPGKGQAIAWALWRASPPQHEAVVMVEADCIASQNLLGTLAAAIAAGADAVQAQYVASNLTEAPAAAPRYAG